MYIIYRMRNGCPCWLFPVTVDIIRHWLSQVTELPFLCWSPYCTKNCVFTTIWQKWSFGVPFHGFKGKRLFRMNRVHGNTDNISHIPILTWPGMTSSFTSHGSVNDITQHFPLNSFLVLSFDTKMSHLKRLWKVLRANQFYKNLPFISVNVSFRETVSLKTFPWIFSHPNFIKNTLIFDVSNGVNVRFVHHVF